MELSILRKLQTSGGKMGQEMNGMRNGGSITMLQAKLRNGPINGVP